MTGVQGAVKGAPAVPPPDLVPIPASAFSAPISAYLRYSEAQLGKLERELATLKTALGSGNVAASKNAWRTAWTRYLRLGAVYLEGQVATLNQRIDGTPGGLPGGTASPHFRGFHRIEHGLWTGASPVSLVPWAIELGADVGKLRRLLPHVSVAPLDYATRAHEILEDAVRDLLSGADVPWSGEGVLGTAAGLAATKEVLATLRPLTHAIPYLASDLQGLQSELASLAAAHGGTLPTNAELTKSQTEALDGAIGQALEGLAQVPGLLETAAPATTPKIPAADFRSTP